MATVMRASQAQRSRVGLEEGIRLEAYTDTVGIWTIGKGHAATNPIPVRGMLNGEFYEGKPKKGVTITPSECERLFELDMDETERGISALIRDGVDLTQAQFDALVDFVHQYGIDRFAGSTLLEKINFNPSSSAVLEQFMRWTMAGGEHQEYVWRRSARRCCIYTGTLIPQKLWRKCNTDGGYPFKLKYDEGWKIDYDLTPTIEQILADGRRLSKPPEPVVNKPWSDIVGAHPEPSITIITDQPASSMRVDDKGGEAPVIPNPPVASPAPSQKPAATVSGPVAGPAVEPKAAPSVSPPTHPGNAPVEPVVFKKDEPKPKEPEKPKAPIVITPKAIDPKSIPYGDVDPSLATNMSDSRRVAGMVVVGLGSMTQILAAREIISSSVGAVFYDMSRDPIVVALFVGGVFWVVGWLTRKRGTQIVTKGMVEAKSVLK